MRSRVDTLNYFRATVVVGVVRAGPREPGPVVVAAYRIAAGRPSIIAVVRLDVPGDFELTVPGEDYRVFAFLDRNANDTLDDGEACSVELGEAGASVRAALHVVDITSDDSACAALLGARWTDHTAAPSRHVQAGIVASLDDRLRSRATGIVGYWQPTEFLRTVGSNIVFVEPYDPAKIPLVLIHGAAGSPQDWRYITEHIDRRRYQPWIFQYPSGAGLSTCAELLYGRLVTLQERYRPPVMVVAAHSMGGLVARRLLLRHGAQLPAIKVFVSLSTPWGGDRNAATGVRLSPTIVPSWIDMVPDGEFLRDLFASPLPAGIEHHLYFGHRNRPGTSVASGDGTVTLASQLSLSAQAEAVQVRGFDEDHLSVLSSPRVMREFNQVLDRFQRQSAVNVDAVGTVVGAR